MIQEVKQKDLTKVADLAHILWPDTSKEELLNEFQTLTKKNTHFFVQIVDNKFVGFSQCSIRTDYVEGCDTDKVGYLEGLFVLKEYRKRGLGKELVQACIEWARKKDCKEFASDCTLDNTFSYDFHKKLGFKEANRIICFTMKI